VPAQRAQSAGGQVLLDQGNGRAGKLRGAAAITDAVATDVMERAVDIDHIPGPVRADLGCGHRNERFAQEALDLGENVGDHGLVSSSVVE
jgi:hypothetical protein